MPALVSILIPAYNAEKWIGETIESAVNQTWPKKEVIVVDDGSTDRTLEVANGYESTQVKVVTQENQGAAATRNRAYSICQGDYVQWLDADDLLAPDKIEQQMETAARCGTKRTLFSSAWGSFIYRVSRAEFTPTPLWRDLSPVEWLMQKMEQNLHMQTGVWLVSRELSEAAGPWDTRLSFDDDGEYFCRVLLPSDGARFVPEAKVFYRTVGSNRLSFVGQSDRKLESLFLSMKLTVGYILSLEDSERTRAACLKYLSLWATGFLHPGRPDLVRQTEQLAASIGGTLEISPLPWKYAWIDKAFGRVTANRSRLYYNQLRSAVMRSWDKLLFRFEGGR